MFLPSATGFHLALVQCHTEEAMIKNKEMQECQFFFYTLSSPKSITFI